MYCQNCGSALSPQTRYCNRCGTNLVPAEEKRAYKTRLPKSAWTSISTVCSGSVLLAWRFILGGVGFAEEGEL